MMTMAMKTIGGEMMEYVSMVGNQFNKLPEYIVTNKDKFLDWID